MATYNGAWFVEEQVRSILAELEVQDEVVIVDDASTDDTVSIIRCIDDSRIMLTAQESNQGYVRTFESALKQSAGDVIFLSDQDDVWVPGRVARMLRSLDSHQVVASNMSFLGGGAAPKWSFSRRNTDGRWRRNIVRILAGVSGYYGSGMAIRRSFKPVVLPFPVFLTESHDLWIGLAGNLARSIDHIEEPTHLRRVHGGNVTPERPRSLPKVLRARVMLIRSINILRARLKAAR